MTNLQLMISIAMAHRYWKGQHAALLVSGDGLSGNNIYIDGIGEASSTKPYDTAPVVLLQNTTSSCSEKRLICTKKPTEMCLGMAWARGIFAVYYPDAGTIKKITPSDEGATARFTASIVTGTAIALTTNNFASTETVPTWSSSDSVSSWYSSYASSWDARKLTSPAFNAIKSYDAVTKGATKYFKARLATPIILGRGLAEMKAAKTVYTELRDKLFTAIAYALVANSFSTESASARKGTLPNGHNIGALLVDANNKIIGWGLNMGKANPTYHAETVMIQSYLQRNNVNKLPKHTRLYTTLEPCHMCAGFLAEVGDETSVIFGQKDGRISNNALTVANTSSSTQTAAALNIPAGHAANGGDAPATLITLIKNLHERRSESVTAFLRSARAATFFAAIADRPDKIAALLAAIDAPTAEAAFEMVPVSEEVLKWSGLTKERHELTGLWRVRPEPASTSRQVVDREAARKKKTTLDALDLAVYSPKRIAAVRTAKVDRELEQYRPQLEGVISILAAGKKLITDLRTAGLIT